MTRTESKSTPLRIDAATLAGKGLQAFPPFPNPPEGRHGHILSGVDNPTRLSAPFEGDVIVQVVEMGPKKIQVVNAGYDEFIHILAGNLILTDDKGISHTFGPGDALVMPKGFTGTWENTGDPYRELIVIETKSYRRDMSRLEE